MKAADTLWNAQSIVADLRRIGPEVWLRFHAGAVDQLWYYRSLSVVLSSRLPGALTDELRATIGEMERLAGWWFDVGDPQREPPGPYDGAHPAPDGDAARVPRRRAESPSRGSESRVGA